MLQALQLYLWLKMSTTLPDSAFTGLEVLVTPTGNIVGRYTETGITGAGSNVILLLEIYARLK